MQGGSGWLPFPLRATPCFLLFKVWVMWNVCVILGQVQNEAVTPPYKVKLIKENYIYGDTSHEVNTYVKVNKDSPVLLCMDMALSQAEIIDPHYMWIGPGGQNLKAKSNVNIAEAGRLVLINFKESMSGSYSCTISYKVIRADMEADLEKFKTYKFMVYAYRDPNYSYRISVHFTTKVCGLVSNGNFFEELMKVLNNMISHLACHIVQSSYKCYAVKRPQQSLADELFIIFQVNPHGAGWKATCPKHIDDCEDASNSRVQKALWFIREFFNKQQDIMSHIYKNIPAIHYVANSFHVTRLDSCHPGFGKNNLIHTDCANCCVACEPGTYSSNSVTCKRCTNIQIKQYGATSC